MAGFAKRCRHGGQTPPLTEHFAGWLVSQPTASHHARMLLQLIVASLLVGITVVIHGLGLLGLSRWLREEQEEERQHRQSSMSLRGIAFTLGIVFALFFLHGVEIWLYALAYLLLGALPDLEFAVFFSTITYSTVGFDNDGFQPAWQLVAAIEGINGVLLMGWSTAFFVSMVGRVRTR